MICIKRTKTSVLSKILLTLGIIVLLIPIVLNLKYKIDNKIVVESFKSQEINKTESKENTKLDNVIRGKKQDDIKDEDKPIGIITIPKINEEIPIYKDINGMLDLNLDRGVVLLSRNTMLKDTDKEQYKNVSLDPKEKSISLDPKETTNMVLMGHRGTLNTNQNIFKNLDKISKGDKFYIDNGEKLLEFKVYEIKIIEPEQGNLIYADKPFNQSTLVTCTPYLINNKRLIVSGGLSKITDNTDSKILNEIDRNKPKDFMNNLVLSNYMNLLIIFFFIFLILYFFIKKKKNKKFRR